MAQTLRPASLFTSGRAALAGLALLVAGAASAQTITTFSPARASAGLSITIAGTGLSTATSVMINGQSMPITLKTATALTVTVPRAASTGRLRVTTSGGGTAFSAGTLQVTRTSSSFNFGQQSTAFAGAQNGAGQGNYSTPTSAVLDNSTGLNCLLVGNGTGNVQCLQQSATSGSGAINYVSQGYIYLAGNTSNLLKVTNYAKPCVTDLDGNGLLDMLVGTGTGKTLERYEQTTANSLVNFTKKADIVISASTGNFPKATVADIDNDGLLDLLVGDVNGNIFLYEQNQPNSITFNYISLLKDNNGNTINEGSTTKPQIIDIDGDQVLDLLIGNTAGYLIRYKLTAANPDIRFTRVGPLTTNGTNIINMSNTAATNAPALSQGGYAAPAIADIDGDGLLDLFVGNGSGTMYRFEQNAAAPTVLPVTFSAFTAQTAATGTQLRWTTASEQNSASFAVQRSADGKTFSTIGEVAAAGNSSTARNYQFLDAAATAGTTYYRLRQVDFDGTASYSAIVALSRTSGTAAAVSTVAYPNPFGDALYVSLPAGTEPQTASIALLTPAGQTVYAAKLPLGTAPQRLTDLPALKPGMYLLRLTTSAGTVTQRVSHQ